MCDISIVYNSFEMFIFLLVLHSTFMGYTSSYHLICLTVHCPSSAKCNPDETSNRAKTKQVSFQRNKAGHLIGNLEIKPFLILPEQNVLMGLRRPLTMSPAFSLHTKFCFLLYHFHSPVKQIK